MQRTGVHRWFCYLSTLRFLRVPAWPRAADHLDTGTAQLRGGEPEHCGACHLALRHFITGGEPWRLHSQQRLATMHPLLRMVRVGDGFVRCKTE